MTKQRITPVDPTIASGSNKKNSDILRSAFGFIPNVTLAVAQSKRCGTANMGAAQWSNSHRMEIEYQLLIHSASTITVILPIACLVAFAGCSGIEGTAENHRVTTNLVKYTEEDHEKTKNPRVRVGQPYDQGLPELARD